MATIFNAVTVMKRGNISKNDVYEADNVPLQVKVQQQELIEVVLIERRSQLLSTVTKDSPILCHKGGRND